jgi:uncharacterized lipoprotein YmbA
MTRLTAAAAIPTLLMLASCEIGHPYPSRDYYVLATPGIEACGRAAGEAIRIGRARIEAPFGSRGFQYRVGDLRYEPTYYEQWADDPGLLIGQAVRGQLGESLPTGRAVVDDSSPVEAVAVDIVVTELYADTERAGAPEAVLSARITLLSPDGEVLDTWGFSQREPAASADPASIVEAWSRAIGDLASDLCGKL